MRRIGSLPVLCLAFVLSLCFATSGPSVPNQVSLGDGAYAVVFTDSLESAGAIQVLSSEGAGLSTTQLHAEDLLTRTDGPQGAVLLGARCATWSRSTGTARRVRDDSTSPKAPG